MQTTTLFTEIRWHHASIVPEHMLTCSPMLIVCPEFAGFYFSIQMPEAEGGWKKLLQKCSVQCGAPFWGLCTRDPSTSKYRTRIKRNQTSSDKYPMEKQVNSFVTSFSGTQADYEPNNWTATYKVQFVSSSFISSNTIVFFFCHHYFLLYVGIRIAQQRHVLFFDSGR